VPSRVVRRIRRLLARFACVLRCLPACLERCVRIGFASLPLRGSLAEGEAGHQRACKGFVAPLSGGALVELAATLHDSALKVSGFLARLPRLVALLVAAAGALGPGDESAGEQPHRDHRDREQHIASLHSEALHVRDRELAFQPVVTSALHAPVPSGVNGGTRLNCDGVNGAERT